MKAIALIVFAGVVFVLSSLIIMDLTEAREQERRSEAVWDAMEPHQKEAALWMDLQACEVMRATPNAPKEEIRRCENLVNNSTIKRELLQVVLHDHDSANSFMDLLRSGKSFEDAAREIGFDVSIISVGEMTKTEFADLTSDRMASAAFSIELGNTTEPMESALGWHVVHAVEERRP